MIELLGRPSLSVIDKLKNVSFTFFILAAWMFFITTILGFMGMPMYSGPSEQVTFLDVFMACICAPTWEELCFRWAPIEIARGLGDQMVLPVILISSVVFGLGHGNGIFSLLVQGVMGFTFSMLYIKNNYSIWTTMLLHSMWNSFVFMIQ